MIKELGCLQDASISILAEDSIAFDTPYVGKFGLSLLLELKAESCQKHILFDNHLHRPA
jgi:metal-dependent hydrolase (beta-lactamase superfamily II)